MSTSIFSLRPHLIAYYEQSLKANENFLIMKYFGRPIALPFVYLFHRLNLKPNQITLMGGFCWLIGLLCFLIPQDTSTKLIPVSALTLALGGILDIADGGVARLRKETSMSGAYLDYVLHFVFNPLLPICIGFFLFREWMHIWPILLGVAAIPGSWGFSQSAKQHIILKNRAIATNACTTFEEAEYNKWFFDKSTVRNPITRKPTLSTVLKKLPAEFFFPGNFFTFPGAIALDLILAQFGISTPSPCLTVLFIFYSATLALSVPFRMKREFQTLKQKDESR